MELLEQLGIKRLRDIIKEKSFRKGKFTLASGKETDYFFDLKQTMLDPEGISLISLLTLLKLERLGYDGVAAVGGMATGAIPLITALSIQSFQRGNPISAFFVRNEVKDHGTKQKVDGLVPADRVIMLEDVTTTGGSVLAAIHAARAVCAKAQIEDVITVIDRLEGAKENLKIEGIKLHALFKRNDFD